MDTPILFVVFNRKETALHTLNAIRKSKTKRLYIAGDGPRKNKTGENLRVDETREAILEAIDWDCEVKTLFQENNLGCGPAVSSAIDWFFTNEEEGIILEDDCVPLESFFPFCEELLAKYRNDDRIGGITGYNPLKKQVLTTSYGFSKYVENWGWASWRRVWQGFDMQMGWRTHEQAQDIFMNGGYNGKDADRWRHDVGLLDKQKINTWDVQWSLSVAAQNQLTIYPKHNLVSNIGVGDEATHTGELSPFLNFKTGDELTFPLIHPNYVLPNEKLDKSIYGQRNNLVTKLAQYFPNNIKTTVKGLWGRLQ